MRIKLDKNDAKTVSIPIDAKAFTVINDEGERIEGSGKWKLYAAFSQPDKRSECLTGKAAVSCEIN